jgi:hypothetical protein
MAGLVPAIHVFGIGKKEDVDARDKRGHDESVDAMDCHNSDRAHRTIKPNTRACRRFSRRCLKSRQGIRKDPLPLP